MSDWMVLVVVTLPLVALWVGAVVEVLRRRDVSGWRTASWIAALVLAPLVGLVAYLVVRPSRPVESSRLGAATERAERIVALAERRRRGELSDADYVTELRASTTR